MKHIIKGSNFHGQYRIALIGPVEGFTLSDSQERKLSKSLCGIEGCTCGGGYGPGDDSNSAHVLYDDYDCKTGRQIARLIPAR